MVSSSNTLLLANNCCTIAEGWVGFKSKENLEADEAALPVEAALLLLLVPVCERALEADEALLLKLGVSQLVLLVEADMFKLKLGRTGGVLVAVATEGAAEAAGVEAGVWLPPAGVIEPL